jgi:hypothetical protein
VAASRGVDGRESIATVGVDADALGEGSSTAGRSLDAGAVGGASERETKGDVATVSTEEGEGVRRDRSE